MVEDAREKVSFDDEPLILVDEHDNEVGYRSKGDCHEGHGTLHRALAGMEGADGPVVMRLFSMD
jgi:isopentenyl-diphosphate delta-isomerase